MIKFSQFSDDDKKMGSSGEAPAAGGAVSLYNEAFLALKGVHEQILRQAEPDTTGLSHLIEKLVQEVSLDEDKFIFLTSNVYQGDYLIYHALNVAILSIRVGLDLKYSPELLVDLGMLALLHGVSGLENQVNSLQDLTKEKIIRKFLESQMPKQGFLEEALGIIATVDVYESLTHSRSYRPPVMPFEVLKAIISASEETFNPDIVREVVRVLSLYPLGSKVRLNTEEVARVVKINRDFPLRPKIAMLLDSHGNELAGEKVIDLSSNLNIYIKEPLL